MFPGGESAGVLPGGWFPTGLPVPASVPLPHDEYDQSWLDTSGVAAARDARLQEARRAIGLVPEVIARETPADRVEDGEGDRPPVVEARVLPDTPPFDASAYQAVFARAFEDSVIAGAAADMAREQAEREARNEEDAALLLLMAGVI